MLPAARPVAGFSLCEPIYPAFPGGLMSIFGLSSV